MAVDTTKKKQEEWTPLGAGSDYYANKVDMSAEDQALLKSYGDAYNNATTDEERRAAHDAAEQLRANYGYKGGTDGSQYIVQPPKATTSTGSTGGFDYSPAPTYTDNYSARIDEMLNNILNRDAFSYNAATDPLYAQYKEQYTREGQRAMKDTLGQVSARTGGLASSYAVSAAQQQNNQYMQQLSDKIPELYQMAYQMYLDDIDLQVQNLGLLEGASNTAYNRYRDTMSDWRDDRDFAYGQYRDDVGDGQWQMNYDRGVFESDRDYDRGVLESDRDYDHTVGRETVEDGRYANETAYDRALELLSGGVMPDASMLSAAGLTSAQANTILANATKPSSTGSSPSYKPKLSASAVVDALEGGVVNDEMLKAYKYYYGQDWDDGEPEIDKDLMERPYTWDEEPSAPKTTEPEGADPEVANMNGASWIYIPGHGRFSWQELEAYVDSGKIKETVTKDGKYQYTWVN